MVDYIIELLAGGFNAPIESNTEAIMFIGTQRGFMMKKLLKFLTKLYDELMKLINNGISISTQLLESLAEAIDMLAHGTMPPIDILKGLIVEVLGILGRKRRDVESPLAMAWQTKILEAAYEMAEARMERSATFNSFAPEQKMRAMEMIRWAIDSALTDKNNM